MWVCILLVHIDRGHTLVGIDLGERSGSDTFSAICVRREQHIEISLGRPLPVRPPSQLRR